MQIANAARQMPALWRNPALDVIKIFFQTAGYRQFFSDGRDPRTACKSACLLDEFSWLNEDPDEINNNILPK